MAGQGDNLSALVALARQDIPDVPDDVWKRFLAIAGDHFGGRAIYVQRRRKAVNLEALAAADASVDAESLARLLGITVRHARRLRKLR